MMTSIRLFGAGSPRSRMRSAIPCAISASLRARLALNIHCTLRGLSITSATTGGMFMVRALAVDGGWSCHSRKVPRAAHKTPAAINSEAKEAAHA
jgi:hypothetical protein